MTTFQKQNRFVAAAVFLFSLVVYFKTCAPSVTFWDVGEFIAASHLFGVPHPPGAPFHTLLGRLFTMLPIPGEIAFRVNLISVLAAAATVLLIHLCVVRILHYWLDPNNKVHRLAMLTGGAVAALSTAFSTSFWANSTEAEVYALSMCFTLLAFWLALRWDTGGNHRDRLLVFIVYLFGLGAGVHLQCLLTVPGILILVFTDLLKDRPLKHQVLVVLGLILYPFLSILLPTEFMILMTLAVLVALVVLQPTWRNPWFWACALLAGLLGFSTYFALIIRSGLNPLVDMNNPETWQNFKAFLSRQQYGTHSIFPRRGDFWDYQFNIHIKYFLQQFPFYDGVTAAFRRAVDTFEDPYEHITYSLLPVLLGIGGAVYHFRKDWKRFASVFAMFALMGIGLVLYLNMPDPEPREREYIFVGAYTFFGLWMGLGAAGLIVAAHRQFNTISVAGLAACLVLLVPLGLLDLNYFSHDRSRDYISHDYAYNLLITCAPNAILFTNGDNDTYPLWFIQYVKGVRKDVRVVNLSLLKTPWYAKQLRDLEPRIPINLSDDRIEQEVAARPWSTPQDISVSGLEIKGKDVPTAEYLTGTGNQRIQVLETHTLMIWWMIKQLNWTRPIYFAVTVPTSNMAGLRPYLTMEGMCFRLGTDHGLGQFDLDKTSDNLINIYHYTGVADSTVYKDAVARRLLGNYLVVFDALIRAYIQTNQPAEAFHVLQEAEKLVPPYAMDTDASWGALAEHYRTIAVKFAEAGYGKDALRSLEELLRLNPNTSDRDQIQETLDNWSTRLDSLP
ncbi:MAG: DUF2723 domain-containing protein [bacterium]|nr:DUF2723 domain-containing protein [bacterium]